MNNNSLKLKSALEALSVVAVVLSLIFWAERSFFFKIKTALQNEHYRVNIHYGLKLFVEGYRLGVSNKAAEHTGGL